MGTHDGVIGNQIPESLNCAFVGLHVACYVVSYNLPILILYLPKYRTIVNLICIVLSPVNEPCFKQDPLSNFPHTSPDLSALKRHIGQLPDGQIPATKVQTRPQLPLTTTKLNGSTSLNSQYRPRLQPDQLPLHPCPHPVFPSPKPPYSADLARQTSC